MADPLDLDPTAQVEHHFDNQLAAGLHHGAQLAAYRDGEQVVDLAGGTTGPDGEPETTDRRHVLFSCTKPYTATCVHKLAEEGALDYDDAVVDHWPEFAEDGTQKATVTVRHVLSHQGGFPVGAFDARPDLWTDWDEVVAAMEDVDLAFEPGTTAAYHPLNYGWVLGEVVRRVAGTPIGEYVEEVLFDPLGMDDTHLGLPGEVPDDVATLVGFEEFDRCREPGAGLDGFENEAVAAQFNQEAFHRAVMPAASGVGTARDMARFYACVANGGELDGTRVLEEATVERATAVAAEVEQDGTLGVPRRYALGFARATGPWTAYGTHASGATFGHGGLGSSVGWADPESGLAVSYVTNGVRDSYEQGSRATIVSDAVRRAYGG